MPRLREEKTGVGLWKQMSSPWSNRLLYMLISAHLLQPISHLAEERERNGIRPRRRGGPRDGRNSSLSLSLGVTMTHRDYIQFICLQERRDNNKPNIVTLSRPWRKVEIVMPSEPENTNSCPFAYPSHYVTLYLLPSASQSQGRNSFFRLFYPFLLPPASVRPFVLGLSAVSARAALYRTCWQFIRVKRSSLSPTSSRGQERKREEGILLMPEDVWWWTTSRRAVLKLDHAAEMINARPPPQSYLHFEFAAALRLWWLVLLFFLLLSGH